MFHSAFIQFPKTIFSMPCVQVNPTLSILIISMKTKGTQPNCKQNGTIHFIESRRLHFMPKSFNLPRHRRTLRIPTRLEPPTKHLRQKNLPSCPYEPELSHSLQSYLGRFLCNRLYPELRPKCRCLHNILR